VGFQERLDDLTARPEPLADLVTPVAGYQRARLVGEQVEEVGAGLAADLEDVPKPTGYQQRRRRCLSFDDGVGGYRGAVREVADRVGRSGLGGQGPVDALQEAERGV